MAEEQDFAKRLARLTVEFGSRYNLAKVSGIPQSTLQTYESGSKPGMEVLITLARTANVDLNWLLTGKGEMRPAGIASGALLADVIMVDQYELGTSLNIPTIVGRIPFSRNFLETRLRLKNPAHDTLLVVEAALDLREIKRGDLVLIDRSQKTLALDGVYLLNLPGMTLRGILLCPGNKIRVQEPVSGVETPGQNSRTADAGGLEMSRSELLGAGRRIVSKVVGRAVWLGRPI